MYLLKYIPSMLSLKNIIRKCLNNTFLLLAHLMSFCDRLLFVHQSVYTLYAMKLLGQFSPNVLPREAFEGSESFIDGYKVFL